MNNCPLVWIIIGVSGSGKTSIGRLLAQKLECDFLEGDRRHPRSNIAKMSSQQPLTEEDRLPWLLEIEDDIRRAIDRNREIVMTCSALKVSYRKQLLSLGQIQLVWIDVAASLLEQRLKDRSGHYMKSEMLHSQMAVFQSIAPEEDIISVDGNPPIGTVIDELMTKVMQRFPTIEKSWWERCLE
jgi:gluconokinase